MKVKLITVVVCTKNGKKKIADCLKSLKNQTYSKEMYQVIVVDDASSDGLSELIEEYKFTLITNSHNLGLAQSRNIGIANSQGDIIAFTDDDCIPELNWLKKINDTFNNNADVCGISGWVKTHEIKTVVQKYIDATKPLKPLEIELSISTSPFFRLWLYLKRQFEIVSYSRWQISQEISSVVGANMAFRRTVFSNGLLFNPILKFGGEEEELCYRIRAKKVGLLYYFPEMKVDHKFERELYFLFKRSYSYAKGNFRLKQIHSERSVTFFPYPLLFLIAFSAILVDIRAFLLLMFLPLILYFQWMLAFMKRRDISILFFPYIQLFTETFYNLGYVKSIVNVHDKN